MTIGNTIPVYFMHESVRNILSSRYHMVVSTNRRMSENQDDDIFTDDAPRSIFSGHQNNHQHPYTAKQSTAVMKALEDKDSELSRFLLCGNDEEDDDMQHRIGVDATWYQMALEPIETRNSR